MRWLSVIILLLFISLTTCTPNVAPSDNLAETPSVSVITNTLSAEPLPSSAAFIVPEREIELVAKTLRGECYDNQQDDKREVAKVICNRVSAGSFGDSIEMVVTKPHQFVGYRPDNEPTVGDYEIAREVLTAWYESGCQTMSENLYFSSDSGHKNVFRKEWKGAS